MGTGPQGQSPVLHPLHSSTQHCANAKPRTASPLALLLLRFAQNMQNGFHP